MPIYDENNLQQSQEAEYLELIKVHLTTEPIGDITVIEEEYYDNNNLNTFSCSI